MNARIVAALIILLVLVASSVSAMELSGSWSVAGNQKTYTYLFTNGDFSDVVTSVHIYAPIDIGLIQGQSGPPNWSFCAVMDPDPDVGADIYWCADDYDTDGILDGGHATFTLTVPSWTGNDNNYVVPGCFANWGFELQSWPDCVIVWFGSVPVPVGTMGEVPEPATLAVIAAGCISLLGLRWRRVLSYCELSCALKPR